MLLRIMMLQWPEIVNLLLQLIHAAASDESTFYAGLRRVANFFAGLFQALSPQNLYRLFGRQSF